MKFKIGILLLSVCFLAIGPIPSARSQPKEDPAHDELRQLMKEVLTAYNAGDLDKLVTCMDEQVVVTWQNAKVSKGRQAVKAYFEEMTKGPNRKVDKSSIRPVADELSILANDGKTAITWGVSNDYYLLMDGTEFTQDTRWSATILKKEGVWQVASVHISVDMFDNPVLHIAIRRTAIWTGIAAGCVGLILGFGIGALVFRRRSKSRPTI